MRGEDISFALPCCSLADNTLLIIDVPNKPVVNPRTELAAATPRPTHPVVPERDAGITTEDVCCTLLAPTAVVFPPFTGDRVPPNIPPFEWLFCVKAAS